MESPLGGDTGGTGHLRWIVVWICVCGGEVRDRGQYIVETGSRSGDPGTNHKGSSTTLQMSKLRLRGLTWVLSPDDH